MKERGAEPALHDDDVRLRAIVDTAHDSVVVVDEHGIIQTFSPAAERLFGYAAPEVIGQNISVLMPCRRGLEAGAFLDRYLSTRERQTTGAARTTLGLRKTGETFPMELSVAELRVDDRRFFVCFIRNLTNLEPTAARLHDLLSKLLHAEQHSIASQVASTIAHGLSQPLTAIVNYLEAASHLIRNSPDAGEKAGALIESAMAQAARAGGMLQRAGGLVPKASTDPRPEDLADLIEETLALALVITRQSGVRLTLELNGGLPPVLVDDVQMQQVLLNLFCNAFEAMQPVHSPELTITTRALPSMAEIGIADTGPGLAPEIADRLFEPFATTKNGHLGLGLSICREIVVAHRGQLTVAPRPKGGTVFRLTLPTIPAEGNGDG